MTMNIKLKESILVSLVFLLFSNLSIASQNYPQIEFTTTSGTFTVELDSNRAPTTVKNFLQYVESGFYVNTIFHRVIAGFVIQAGGFTVDLELKETLPEIINESGNGLTNQRMSLGMARSTDPHTASSQFYINVADNFSLDPMPTRWGYAVFGDVIDGFQIIDAIAGNATQTMGGMQDVPAAPVIILDVKRID